MVRREECTSPIALMFLPANPVYLATFLHVCGLNVTKFFIVFLELNLDIRYYSL